MDPRSRPIQIPEHEIMMEFVRASGPGGQNVNKVATAVRLRFDVEASRALKDEVKERLRHVAGRRITAEGVLLIEAQRFRTQEKNREDAVARLHELIAKAAERPKARTKTKPSRASRAARLEKKRQHSATKKGRREKPAWED